MSNKTILIIDDHKDFRETLRSFIQKRFLDVEIKEAETGEIGVEMAKREKPEVCLVDIRLRGIDGIETSRRIKEHLPDCRIITMSMFKQASVQELINKKIIVFVNKGDIDSELMPFLNKFLDGKIKKGEEK
ncbi:MAG: response regulator transcription factor [Candidatus Omnitrophica bacterium]|nr:response regulator transcription factor [Candidatus Omnitrophota bacterium]